MFWSCYLGIIWFSEPDNGEYGNQLLILKGLSFLYTLSQLHLLYPNCPSVFLAQHPQRHPNLHVTTQSECFLISFGDFLSSLFIVNNPKFLLFQFRNPNSKLQGGVKMHLLACLQLICLSWALVLSLSLSSRSHESPRESEKNEMELEWREQVPKNQNPNLQMHHKLANSCPRQHYQQEITPNISHRPLNWRSP